MGPDQVVKETEQKLKNAVERLENELKKLRTGRASADILDGIVVQAYGQNMPLNQVANVTAPEAQLLQITPFDPNNLQAISLSIRDNQSLGLNPTDDGRVVRVPIPPLTEERRREIAKQVGVRLEDSMIAMRNIRHDALDAISSAKKSKEIGEDEAKRFDDKIENSVNKVKSEAESIAKLKEQEIMTV